GPAGRLARQRRPTELTRGSPRGRLGGNIEPPRGMRLPLTLSWVGSGAQNGARTIVSTGLHEDNCPQVRLPSRQARGHFGRPRPSATKGLRRSGPMPAPECAPDVLVSKNLNRARCLKGGGEAGGRVRGCPRSR